jgi:hypothetical protein
VTFYKMYGFSSCLKQVSEAQKLLYSIKPMHHQHLSGNGAIALKVHSLHGSVHSVRRYL